MINSLFDAEKYLSQFIAKTSKVTGRDVTIDRMWPLLELAGNPQDSLKVIHIAGTSGKTSTAYYCSALLTQTGKKVGLTVSPHVTKLTERLQINGAPVSDEDFCKLLNDFVPLLGTNFDASYFEFMIVFVLWSFVQLNVDYAVIETGLGGLHDGTNVFRRRDKICVITDIGYDHQHILGTSLHEIATQKAGIIQQSNEVFMYEQDSEIMEQILSRALSMSAHVNLVESTNIPGNLPIYQKRNWKLAYETYSYICLCDGLTAFAEVDLLETMIVVPGRMQEVDSSGTKFVLDGAHNVQKISALVSSFRDKYGSNRVPCILAMKEDKDFEECIPLLSKIVSRVYACEFTSVQDMPIQSVDSEELAAACRKSGLPTTTFSSIGEALKAVEKENEPVILVTGSFYLLKSFFLAIKN